MLSGSIHIERFKGFVYIYSTEDVQDNAYDGILSPCKHTRKKRDLYLVWCYSIVFRHDWCKKCQDFIVKCSQVDTDSELVTN